MLHTRKTTILKITPFNIENSLPQITKLVIPHLFQIDKNMVFLLSSLVYVIMYKKNLIDH